ncbi:MAG: hypothetical protein VX081_02095, partial [Pseudomonadota bacterium]|nr:hypothetical protein [Pseudomonadota bacterium]
MSANQSDRRLLIDQLAWQEAIGIDEALFDDAADDTTVTLSALAAPAMANRPATAPPIESQEQELPSGTRPSSSLPETVPAPIPAPAPVRQLDAPPPELAGIASLEELRTALESFEGCALKH